MSAANNTPSTIVEPDSESPRSVEPVPGPTVGSKVGGTAPNAIERDNLLSWEDLDEQSRVRLRKAYVFLSKSTYSLLRMIARKWSVVQTGGTQNRILLSRIFSFMVESVIGDTHTVNDILGIDHSWGYVQFLLDWIPELDKIEIPDLDTIRKEAALKPKASKKTGTKGSNTTKSTRERKADGISKAKGTPKGKKKRKDVLSTSDFTRLLLIFKYHQEIRDRFNQCLTKAELDNGIKSKDFWDDHVARIYNDPNFRPRFNPPPALKGINPSKTPTIRRDGTFLESSWRKFQGVFSELEAGYRNSGQNCPGFETYLTEIKKIDVLSGIGQLVLVAGELIDLGNNDHEDKDLLDVLSKKSNVLGHEGVLQKKLPSFLMKEEKPPSGGNKKTNRQSLEKASGAIVELCQSFQQSMEHSSRQPGWNIDEEQKLLKQMGRAEQESANPVHSDNLRERWRLNLEKIRDELDKSSPSKGKNGSVGM